MHNDDRGVGLNDVVFSVFDSCLRDVIDGEFLSYLCDYPVGRWGVFSDYVRKQKGRPHSAFVFTVVPMGAEWERLYEDAGVWLKRDFKNIKRLSEDAMRFLRDRRFFTFAFILDPDLNLYGSKETFASVVSKAVESMETWENIDQCKSIINCFREYERKSSRNSFSLNFANDVFFVSTIAAYILHCICKNSVFPVERVAWFSDRDSMVTSDSNIANAIFQVTLESAHRRWLYLKKPPELIGLNDMDVIGAMWCDRLLRVPDYIAGPLTCFDESCPEHGVAPSEKYGDMLGGVIADNNRVVISKINVDPDEDVVNLNLKRLFFKRAQS